MRKYVGEQLGNYRVLRLLGEGGQASVYLGEHVYLKSQAALKVRHTVLTEEEQTVFLQEAQTLVRLTHPHIVRILDFAIQDGIPFLVMEYALHGTLRQRHPKGTQLPLGLILPYIQQVASSLQYTHDQGLIHRDVKPENMLLNSHDQVLLSDFGLVMLAPQLFSSEATEPMEKSLVGTASYLAPEQLRGKAQSASDQYGLGVVVYEWLCGKPPFRGPFLEVAVQHVSAPPPSLLEQVPDLSPAIEEAVLRALAKEPERRFPCVQDFATALAHASQEAVSPRLTPVLAPEHGVATGPRPSSMRQLPTGTVTLLFTDMEGSTRLLQQVGEGYAGLLEACRSLLRAAFFEFDGYEVDTQGDAFFVAFARATDAVAAAVAGQRALFTHAWPEGITVRVRMGLHTGEPQRSAEGYVGLGVHHAARIMSAGHGGQVLLSQTTRDLVEHDLPDDVSLRDLGAHRLKDLQHPSHLFQLIIGGLPADFPPLKTLDTHPNNLPVQLTSLIGRGKEVATVQHLLHREDVRLLTLTGPGGTGKTRLGLQVAAELSDRFADGVYFVNLAPISDPALVVPTIAQTLDVKEVADHPLLDLVIAFLREKQVLLLLDNFEQVVSAAERITALLATCPQLKVLVTSREVLHVRGEQEVAVPPLSLPDPKRLPDLLALSQYEAVALFLQRAQAARPEFQVTTANAPAVAEICIRLDGLPLAIELAAARIKLLPPQALLARLGQRLQVLTSGVRDAPTRQQTLWNTIKWSYDLLNAREQRLFRRLSVFVGGCRLSAAEAVCGAGGDAAAGMGGSVLDGVASLMDKSLLQQTEQDSNEPRLAMLETIREYGLEMLSASGEMETTQHAHAAYYLTLAEKAEPELEGPQQIAWLERLEREHDNLRAVLEWSLKRQPGEEVGRHRELTLRLGKALMRFWITRGYVREGLAFLEQALMEREDTPTTLLARAQYVTATLVWYQGDYDRVEELCQQSLTSYRELADQWGIATCLHGAMRVALARGNAGAAQAWGEEALAIFRTLGDKGEATRTLEGLTLVALSQGNYAEAESFAEECLSLGKAIGMRYVIARPLLSLARIAIDKGEHARAHQLLSECLSLSHELGDKGRQATALALSGRLALAQGDTTTARSLAGESLVLFRESGDHQGAAESLSILGMAEAAQGDFAAAQALYAEWLTLAGSDERSIAFSLEGLADAVVARGQLAWAVRLWSTAETVRDRIGIPMQPGRRAAYTRKVTATRAQLGEQAFAAAWAAGRTMTPEQASVVPYQASLSEPVPQALHAPQPPAPTDLTAREREVLRLLARGLSNAQIAEELIVSLLTVKAHLRSIYSKLGVTSRSAATRYALEHHLS